MADRKLNEVPSSELLYSFLGISGTEVKRMPHLDLRAFALGWGGRVNAYADLNTFRKPGIYRVAQSGGSTHMPAGLHPWGSLIVMRCGDEVTIQVYISYLNTNEDLDISKKIAVRCCVKDGEEYVWYKWRVFTGDIVEYLNE